MGELVVKSQVLSRGFDTGLIRWGATKEPSTPTSLLTVRTKARQDPQATTTSSRFTGMSGTRAPFACTDNGARGQALIAESWVS